MPWICNASQSSAEVYPEGGSGPTRWICTVSNLASGGGK